MTQETITISPEPQNEKVKSKREKIKEKIKRPIGEKASQIYLVPDNGQYPEPIESPPEIEIPNYPA